MIVVRDLTLRRGAKVVLEGAGFVLNPGEKVGLVGRNGAGKSSLFSLLAGRLQADQGDAEIPPRWVMSEVAQHMPETSDGATDFVLEGDAPLQRAQAMLLEAEASGDGHAMADAHVALQDAGAFDSRARAQALLLGLGFAIGQLDAPVNSFSGGWRMRLQLARALMCPADLLLLDEPTNHLDLDALVWLEAWLKRLPATMIVISHDREFLDATTQVTLHVDEGQVQRYGGNYSAFEMMRAERIAQAQQAFAKQQERIAHLQRFIDRFKAKASKARQAQSRVKALARMEKIAPMLTAGDFQFEFREPANIPNPMLALREVACGYGSTTIVRRVERTVLAGQRIGILGANGQGKSTLVKTVARMLPALGGEIVEGKGLAIGYFAQQEMDLLSEDDTPLQRMVRLAREVSPAAREQELRNFLGQFRFAGDMVHQRVGTLSGGERARLVLATIVWQRPNLLLLDEPTNHLDLTTREALSMALNEFEGTVLLVSHDRALLRETCDEFWLVTRGGVQPFDGDLDDYQAWLLEVAKAVQRGLPPPEPGGWTVTPAPPAGSASAASSAVPSASAAPPPAAKDKPKGGARAPESSRDERQAGKSARAAAASQTRPLRQEIARIDERLARLGTEKAEVERDLAQPDRGAEAYADLGRRLAHIGAEMAMLEERWLEVSTQLESIAATP
ncbi:MAG: ATP-binding cassette domain-containing protein [Rubrivivax sp.]|jgi:ATP-binding cassette subfamily F protein 3|nr:ATP-binding cassette domain-containing protein [Rubrivivax sp.]